MKALIFKWHRLLAVVLALPVVLWALSGMMHPFIANWFKPEIHQRVLPTATFSADELVEWQAPEQVLATAGIAAAANLHIVKIQQLAYYQLVAENASEVNRYFSVTDGTELVDGDQLRVCELAAAYAGLPVDQINLMEPITSFGLTYPYINRYLPVYRVGFANSDGLQIYVDPLTGKLAGFSNQLSRCYHLFFSYAHTWGFLGKESDLLRIIPVLICITLAAFVGVTGVANFFLLSVKRKSGTRRKMTWSRKLHRVLGISASVFFLMFSLSGVAHVAAKFRFDWTFTETRHPMLAAPEMAYRLTDLFRAQEARTLQSIALARIDAEPYYRVQWAPPQLKGPAEIHYFHTQTGEELATAETLHAISLAREFTGLQDLNVSGTEKIVRFGKTYSFIFKRLPVVRFNLTDAPYLNVDVDTLNSRLSKKTTVADIVSAIVFLNVHKFHFLDPINKELRDWVSVIAAFMIVLTAAAGLMLLWSKKRLKGQ